MRTLSLGLLIGSALMVSQASVAVAQTASPTPPRGAVGSSQTISTPPPTLRTGPGTLDGTLNEAFMHHLTRLSGYVHTPETDRADRVSKLIDAGKCSEARALADKEGDVLMASKVPAVCEAKRRGLL